MYVKIIPYRNWNNASPATVDAHNIVKIIPYRNWNRVLAFINGQNYTMLK